MASGLRGLDPTMVTEVLLFCLSSVVQTVGTWTTASFVLSGPNWRGGARVIVCDLQTSELDLNRPDFRLDKLFVTKCKIKVIFFKL